MTLYMRPQDYRYVSNQIYEGHLDNLVARQVIAPDPNVPKGAQEASRWKYDVPEEGAEFLSKGSPYPKVTSTGEKISVPIFKIGLGVEYDEWDLESARSLGQFALDKKLPRDIGRKIAEKEDKYILVGDSDIGQSGLYGNAGNTFGCTTKWDAAGADPFDDFNDAFGLVEADDFKPQWMIMNPQDKKLVRKKDAYGNSYIDMIQESFGFSLDDILTSNVFTKGTALLGTSGKDIAELKMPEDIVVLAPEKREDTITVNAREKIGMDIYETDAFCTITNIS